MTFDIKTIEDLSLNAWPSHQIQVYDGWILRFSYFYTHRTNSVEQIGPSILPFSEKINYCEQIYKRWQTPCIFKITPLSDPSLENLLIEKGYHTEHRTNVMVLDLNNIPDSSNSHTNGANNIHITPISDTDNSHISIEGTPYAPVHIQYSIPLSWIHGLFDLKQTTDPIHRKIVPSMYAAIPKDVISAFIQDNGRIIATGLGILDRDYIGIYAIHVDETYRGQHYATKIVHTLLSEGKKKGATRAYLQVVFGNQPAISLYRKVGFRKLYTYWFRVK